MYPGRACFSMPVTNIPSCCLSYHLCYIKGLKKWAFFFLFHLWSLVHFCFKKSFMFFVYFLLFACCEKMLDESDWQSIVKRDVAYTIQVLHTKFHSCLTSWWHVYQRSVLIKKLKTNGLFSKLRQCFNY